MITVADAIPDAWTSRLSGEQVGLGLDVATTENGTSNPSSLTVSQSHAGLWYARLILSWKTADPEVTRAVLALVLSQLNAVEVRPRRLCIDASNEKFFATQLRREFSGRVPVELVTGQQKLTHRGIEMDAKTLLGNLFSSLLEDGLGVLPADDFVAYDYRLVKREAGGFVTETGKNGEHGDCFDSGKLSHWALTSGSGVVRADPLPVGTFGHDPADRPGIKNKWLRRRVSQERFLA
ncbi:hypothetical protein HNR46_001298 [Haloferula luteola]|uniref:Uncharacterized protein n=1 Tax=Haloferula luteola TaxID=595692 RepID=A0A840V611_9BACT|nr:hypothetical protein [Haloferula luteola]MBB5351064.1 hypothetical protein [Haloferula luteola]